MTDLRDIEELVELIINIIKTLDVEKYEVISSYL